MSPRGLRRSWREGDGHSLACRRAVAGLSLLSAGCLGAVALYQLGLIRHLPDPPLPGLGSDRVVGSDEAYALLETPDAVLGVGSYAATLGLAAAGGADRALERPWLPLALAAKVAFDAVQAASRARRQWPRHGALCSWCLLAAGSTFAALPLVLPEAASVLRHLTRGETPKPREPRREPLLP